MFCSNLDQVKLTIKRKVMIARLKKQQRNHHPGDLPEVESAQVPIRNSLKLLNQTHQPPGSHDLAPKSVPVKPPPVPGVQVLENGKPKHQNHPRLHEPPDLPAQHRAVNHLVSRHL